MEGRNIGNVSIPAADISTDEVYVMKKVWHGAETQETGTMLIRQDLERLPGGVIIYRASPGYEILYANRKAAEIWGCASGKELVDFLDASMLKAALPADVKRAEMEMIQQLRQGQDGVSNVEFRTRSRDGQIQYVEIFGRVEEDDRLGKLVYASVYKKQPSRSNIDRLTGLSGYTQFISRVQDILEMDQNQPEREPRVFIFLNVEAFRLLNERFGMEAGDRCIRLLAQLLIHTFPGDPVVRQSIDHFCLLTSKKNAEPGLSRIRSVVQEQHPEWHLVLDAGIYEIPTGEIQASVCMSCAKEACRSIYRDMERDTAWYDSRLAGQQALERYVAAHIDEAVEKGWIQVFYQPVIRTVNDSICSMEALARWIDPEYGMLRPAEFIPVLEKTKQIIKLDKYMVQSLCQEYERRINQGKTVVPVSFNLSRYDLLVEDMAGFVDAQAMKYHVPKDMLYVEITESVLMDDRDVIYETIKKFHQLGYAVWMDDFGSRYSSLNLLKDYDFDEIKLDMAFFSTFSEKSREIVKSIVSMAKRLHTHTLAEGIETEEEYRFLQSIGCEKVQGYVLARPDSYDRILEAMQRKKLPVEMRKDKRIYEKAGQADFLTPGPFCVVEMEGESVRYLYIHPEYLSIMKMLGINEEEVMHRVPHSLEGIKWERLRDLLLSVNEEGDSNEQEYNYGHVYLRMSVRLLGKNGWRRVYVCRIQLLNREIGEWDASEHSVSVLLNSFYRVAMLWDLEKDYNRTLINRTSVPVGTIGKPSAWMAGRYRKYVHPEDQDRYAIWIDGKTLPERLQQSGHLYDLFRTKNADGSYSWKTHFLFASTERNHLVYATAETRMDNREITEAIIESLNLAADGNEKNALARDIWESVLSFFPVKLFWKDREWRFLGASRAFLDYYGIRLRDLIGKTDEDMGWHVNDHGFREAEEACIHHGKLVINKPGHCIVNGMEHAIVTTKVPLHRQGKIQGLIGYFMDSQEEAERQQLLPRLLCTDIDSGALNLIGIMDRLSRYHETYARSKQNFAILDIQVLSLENTLQSYGVETERKLARTISDRIRGILGIHGVLGRVERERFLALMQVQSRAEAEEAGRKIQQRVYTIKEIDGYPVTVQVKVQCRLFSEEGMSGLLANLGKSLETLLETRSVE